MPGSEQLLSDHLYAVMDSPRKLKRMLDSSTDKLVSVNKKLKVQRQRVRRLKKTVDSLSAVVKNLKQQKLVSDSCLEVLESTYSCVSFAMMKCFVEHRGKILTRKAYPPELRAFALTLQFYSTKAYNCVQNQFKLALPSPSSIRRWYQCVDGLPGFTTEALSPLKARADDAKSRNEQLLCALMIDEMSIHKRI